MKLSAPVSIVIVILALSAVSCDVSGPENFNIDITTYVLPDTADVVYTATKTGEATVTSLSYVDDFGTQTVNSPVLPWTITINVNSGTTITMNAQGSISNGSVQIKLQTGGHTGTASESHY